MNLENIRRKLERLEDNIILNLFERTEFKTNDIAYIPGGLKIRGSGLSYFDFLFYGLEWQYSRGGRYNNLEEKPFFTNLPPSQVKRKKRVTPVIKKDINFNPKIRKMYFDALQKICEKGDDDEYGSGIEHDIRCLQDISKRVHLGVFVAESKFKSNPKEYSALIRNRDREGIIKKLRDEQVEEKIINRVRQKGERYNMNSKFITEFYKDKIIPMTIKVEVEYLLS
jgi:chorismate mutase